MAWGYRWDGLATGRDMLLDIVAADDRLFAKLGDNASNPIRIFGIGYDADDDGVFGIDDDTSFDQRGIALGSAPFFAAAASDDGDFYAEGWTFGFWHYGIAAENPYAGGEWLDIQIGMVSRELMDGGWDSWAFEGSTTPPFDAYAENPQAAPSPFSAGDYDRDGDVDADDYLRWRDRYGTHDAAADGNRNGVVDAADYTVWRNAAGHSNVWGQAAATVPEPHFSLWISALALVASRSCGRRGG
jgi:hypothetical protein